MNVLFMLSYSELKPGMVIEYEGSAYEVMEADFLRMQQRKPVMKTKLKDMVSGKVRDHSFQPSDQIDEAEMNRMQAQFIYESKGQYWFNEVGNPKNRFALDASLLGMKAQFLKPNTPVVALEYKEKIINLDLPIKMDFKVTEAPPAIKGDTASGGSKQVVLETGARVNTPLFIGEGDIVRVNTETGDYVERVEKA